MTSEIIQANKAEFLSLCHDHIRRDGILPLLQYLETTDFYTAPSSKTFHLNEPGGLCQHSLNVFHTACAINDAIVSPAIERGDSAFTKKVSTESIAVTALFHDLCKTKIYHEKELWRKDGQGRWESYSGYEIKDDFPFGHGEKSCIIINWFMRLRKEELLAIRWHMGMFEMTEVGSSSRFSYRAAMEQSPLVSLLQTADMLTAGCLEKTNVLT